MPTTRTRRKRRTVHKPVAQRLFDGLPIEKTEENRQELINLKYFGWSAYLPDIDLGKRLERLATGELTRWSDD